MIEEYRLGQYLIRIQIKKQNGRPVAFMELFQVVQENEHLLEEHICGTRHKALKKALNILESDYGKKWGW